MDIWQMKSMLGCHYQSHGKEQTMIRLLAKEGEIKDDTI